MVFLFLLFGLPGLALAFMPFNGRPIYNSLPHFFKFLTAPKILIFHKEADRLANKGNLKDAQMASPPQKPKPDQPMESTDDRLKKVETLLRQTSSEERDIAGKLK
jgi:hypothetical protein